MNRVGRLLICIAGGVALSVTARGDVAPVTPNGTGAYHNTIVGQNTRNTNLLNRLMMMEKLHARLQKDRPQFATPIPQPNAPRPRGASAMAVPATLPAAADTSALSGNPYASIVTRNVFGLNPIPPSLPGPPTPTGPPPPKITLTGITTIFGPPEALFKVAGVIRNGRPQDESYIFTEGEMQDDVQVTKIDSTKKIVSFLNHGVAQDIPLTDGVASSGSAPSAPTWPGQPAGRKFGRRFGGFGGNPGFQPQSYNSYGGGGGGGNNSSQNGYNNAFNGNGQQSNYHDLGANISPAVSQLSAEDRDALVAAAHAQAISDPNSTVPPEIFPPTQYDQEAQNTLGTGNSATPPGSIPPPASPR